MTFHNGRSTLLTMNLDVRMVGRSKVDETPVIT